MDNEVLTEEQRRKAREYWRQNREKQLKQARERYRRKREQYLAKARERREKNGEQRRDRLRQNYDPNKRKAYYQAHYERLKEQRKESDARNRDKINERSRRYYEAHKGERKRYASDRRSQDPAVIEARERRELFRGRSWLRRIYWTFRGILPWQRIKEIWPQIESGPCEICGKTGERMRIDHCHRDLIFRGLLCHGCNVSLGHFHDDPALLRKAAAYLEKVPT